MTSADVRLAADSSVLNIPINLLQDIVNIPYNEVQTLDYLGDNLLFTGTWNIASSTSVWGTDPADIGRYYGLANLFVPFPAFSNAVGEQTSGLATVLLPIHPGCGITCDDFGAFITSWLQADRIMALLTTGQYTFDTAPVTDQYGTHPPQGVWNYAGVVDWGQRYNHPEWNTTDSATGPMVPWAGTTFKLDPLSPVTNYLAHLMSDPNSEENAIKLPTADQTMAALKKFGDGLVVDFWPVFPGSVSVYCLTLCGPSSDLGEPFWHDPPLAPDDPRQPDFTVDDLLNLLSGKQNAAGKQKSDVTSTAVVESSTVESVGGPSALKEPEASSELNKRDIVKKTDATTTDDEATSTEVLDHQTKPPVTNDGKKFEPRRISEKAGPRNGFAAAVKSGLDQLRSSLSPKKSSKADNDKPKDDESDSGGD
jgi:hypothetical protein